MKKFMRKKPHANSGFTLIELMLSSVIMLIAIAASGALYVAQTKMSKEYSNKLDTYSIADMVISEIASAPAAYPVVANNADPTQNLVYVKCVTDNSLDVGALRPAVGDTGLGYRLMPLSQFEGNDFKKRALNGGAYCPPGGEIHLRYQDMYNVCVTVLHIIQKKNQSDPTVTEVSKVVTQSSLVTPQLSGPVGAVVNVGDLQQACQ